MDFTKEKNPNYQYTGNKCGNLFPYFRGNYIEYPEHGSVSLACMSKFFYRFSVFPSGQNIHFYFGMNLVLLLLSRRVKARSLGMIIPLFKQNCWHHLIQCFTFNKHGLGDTCEPEGWVILKLGLPCLFNFRKYSTRGHFQTRG